MAGKAIVSFGDFVTATNERQITGPTDIINEAVLHTYTLADMLRGKGQDQVVQSGSSITDRTQFTAGSQFEWYSPNQQFNPTIEDTLTKLKADWRFGKDCWAWVDHEIELNDGDRFVQYKALKTTKRQACMVSLYNGLEASLWATPDTSTMEVSAAVGGRPYSIRCFITDDGNAPAGFTTIMGVDPSTNPKWKNQVAQYAIASFDSTLIPAMDTCWRKCKFEKPDSKGGEAFRDTKFAKFRIYTSLDGWINYVRLTRDKNDSARAGGGGGYDLGAFVDDTMYGGIPVKYIEQLDSVGWATGQPRYFFVNFEFLFPVFHAQRYMWETDPIQGGSTQPYSYVVYKDTWMNLFCRSRWRQGIVVGA